MADNNESSDNEIQENSIQVNLDDDIAQGVYSNFILSTMGKEDVVLDFAFIQPHIKKGKIRSRVIMTPRTAKNLLNILQKDLAEYESKNGSIDGLSDDNQFFNGIDLSFN
ncbi:DUF3467 domain-containing protein [Candidatus Marinamargulisbacteria bacterium SCGC AG-410-N11]|nr:DUF3467 domain-containing protein [Candidatus Marinamargulisbacteria bacterium SCGC AG-410-N11]